MEIETKRISTEIIKPSLPTPKSLQIHHLSFLDQMVLPLFIPFVYFYQSSNPKITNSEKSKQLKKSLSEALSRYYPLAGRLCGNRYVDCNDSGAPFVEAEADCDLTQVISDRNLKSLEKFLPCRIDEPQEFCMAVQATYFRCGGLAIATLISHKIGDGLSYVMFVRNWSAIARDGDRSCIPLPKFDGATYFPPLDNISGPVIEVGKEDIVGRTFTFPAEKIAALRHRYSGGGQTPSRVEALSAFIWRRYISATGLTSDSNKIHIVRHAVNLRSRVNPPLSENHFGNFSGPAVTMAEAGDGGAELVRKMRRGLNAVNGRSVEWVNNSENHLEEATVGLDFSSICGFPFYETDFGWGRPVWVGLRGFPLANLVLLIDTKDGTGIEAIIHLSKQDMDHFHHVEMFKSNL